MKPRFSVGLGGLRSQSVGLRTFPSTPLFHGTQFSFTLSTPQEVSAELEDESDEEGLRGVGMPVLGCWDGSLGGGHGVPKFFGGVRHGETSGLASGTQ